ncbi:ImmA/IrrE family metallo-endopeptidase [Propionicicella superfundia]|uniref:ImmA/IrrE family metallo-endopeptidase n=1 Tax=Propionicicella superfundia TaxID=348582 RepID=UPI0012EBD435|nr:ImmA/IrrE family metallo-endopeptidase [Propionicicella superfundia]
MTNSEHTGQRLRSARERAGLTQAEAAVELGVSRPLLIAIEKGTRDATPAELVKLAELYGRPLSEILRPSEPPAAIGARFRTALATTPGAQEIEHSIQELERNADHYLDLLRRSSSSLPGHSPAARPVDGLDTNVAAETLALDERTRLGLGDGPIDRLRETLEIEVGLRVFVLPLPRNISGLFVYLDPLGGCVAVNANHPRERRRWTKAHEYAHFIVNRNKPEITEIPGRKRLSESERFADAFAANFLMPRTGLIRRFNELKRSKAERVTPASLVQLAHSYGVSAQAMTLRLEDLSMIPAGTWDKLKDHDFQPRKAAEQLGIQQQRESIEAFPVHYRSLAVQLYADAEISESQLSQYLDTDIVGARQAYQELTTTSDIGDDGMAQIFDLRGSD